MLESDRAEQAPLKPEELQRETAGERRAGLIGRTSGTDRDADRYRWQFVVGPRGPRWGPLVACSGPWSASPPLISLIDSLGDTRTQHQRDLQLPGPAWDHVTDNPVYVDDEALAPP